MDISQAVGTPKIYPINPEVQSKGGAHPPDLDWVRVLPWSQASELLEDTLPWFEDKIRKPWLLGSKGQFDVSLPETALSISIQLRDHPHLERGQMLVRGTDKNPVVYVIADLEQGEDVDVFEPYEGTMQVSVVGHERAATVHVDLDDPKLTQQFMAVAIANMPGLVAYLQNGGSAVTKKEIHVRAWSSTQDLWDNPAIPPVPTSCDAIKWKFPRDLSRMTIFTSMPDPNLTDCPDQSRPCPGCACFTGNLTYLHTHFSTSATGETRELVEAEVLLDTLKTGAWKCCPVV